MKLSHTPWIKFLWGLKTRRFVPKITWYSTSSSEYSMHDTKFDPIISANFLKCISCPEMCTSWLFSSNNLFILQLLPLNHILANIVSRRGPILIEERAQERMFSLSYPNDLSFPSQALMSSRDKEKQSCYHCSKKLILQKGICLCVQDLD